ncbi:MAG: DUF3800 domain-containing protein [Chloroflexi bacterium]|nr:DUF3800 domain-containing protein [Chloroflexota bacterium]
MYLLYLDESGDPDSSKDKHFVLAGAAVFERQTFHLSNALDAVQARHFPGSLPVVFHAAPIRSGKDFWRRVEKERRQLILREIGGVLANAYSPEVTLFSVTVELSAAVRGEAAVKRAVEVISNRFDLFLKRLHREGNSQRGLVVLAEGRYHKQARLWVQGFRQLGTLWGPLMNMADIPFFASPTETRLLQLADYIAHAAFRLYEHHDPSLIEPILHRFDQDSGILHGFVHSRTNIGDCDCPACASRRTPRTRGSWL